MAIVGLAEAIRRTYQRPLARAYIKSGSRAERYLKEIVSARVEAGYDMAASTCSITLGTKDAPFWANDDVLRVEMGYGGAGGVVFNTFIGLIETNNQKYAPRSSDIQAAGYAKRLQRPYGNPALLLSDTTATTPAFSYNSQTDTQIWNDLMRRAGVAHYDAGDGDGITYATQRAYDVALGSKLGDIISKLDESSKNGQRTFEIAGYIYRRPVLGVPSASVAWHYAEGNLGLTAPYLPIIDVTRNVSDKDIQNQAIVKGVQSTSETDTTPTPVMATIQAVNDKLGKDGEGNDIYVPHNISSDFLETRAQCIDVAKRYMIEFNKETDDLTLRCALNPGIFPGQSIGITASKIDVGTERPYWVRHVSHEWGTSGGFTTVQLEGGAGADGLLIGLRPVAVFQMAVTSEVFEVGGVLDTWYTVMCDATTSYDPDGDIVGYAWSATNGASGSGVTWSTRFSQAQWDDPDTAITLTVTDNNTGPGGPMTGTVSQSPTGADTGNDSSEAEGLYVAAGGTVAASPDGGATWGTWTVDAGASATCVTRLSPDLALFGLSDGRLMLTQDHLASAPTVAHTFPAAVTAVWVHEADNNKVAVGLANGDFWITKDAFETAPVLKRNFTHPINWINGSIEQLTQWRIATGSYVWITYDDGTTVGTLSTQANTVEQIELSNFANYNVENTDAAIKVESIGTTLTYPALSPPPVQARLAHFLRTDELMVVDDQSRAFVKASGTNALTAVTALANGAIQALMASRHNPKVFYAGTTTGLYKTYDSGQSWYRVKAFASPGALQLGIDSEPVVIKQVAKITEYISGGKTNPYGNDMAGFALGNDGTGDTPDKYREWTPTMGAAATHGIPVGVSWLIDNTTPNPPETEYPNFWLPAFDDSAWAVMEFSWGGYTVEALPRAWSISPKRDPANILDRDAYMVFRHTMVVDTPAQPYQKVILAATGWKQIVKLWFNGTQVHGAGSARGAQETTREYPTMPYHLAHDGVYYMDVTDLVLPGANNVLAGYFISHHTGLPPGTLSYRLAFNTATAVSQSTEGASTFYVTTTEESRAYDLLNYATLATYPSGHVGAVYLKDPPAGWTNQTFDDSGWGASVSPGRMGAGTIPRTVTDLRLSLEHGSQYLGSNYVYPNPGGVGLGSAIRQHWAVAEGTPTVAKLSLRWRHRIKAWLNGTLVYQNDDDIPATNPATVTTLGKLGEVLDLDVLTALKPGEDNVLAIQVFRADSYPAAWFPGDFVGACAILEVQ